MIVAFFESIKYVGHLIPISLLRIFLGYFYLNHGLESYRGGYTMHAYLAEDIHAYFPKSTSPDWYKNFLDLIVIPNWQIFAYAIILSQVLIGISYILGYLVRPFAFLGFLMTLGLLMAVGTQPEMQSVLLVVVHICLGWIGAGRCLGFDYFFFKRHRGIWW